MSQNRLIEVSELRVFASGIRADDERAHFLSAVDASRDGSRMCLRADLEKHLNGSRWLVREFLRWQVMPPETTFADDREWMAGVDSALAS
ncbi:MAG: hypothetical protein WCT36_02160 [Candidatus Gracilibacteria bacterium]|jgi:hypothetical protein